MLAWMMTTRHPKSSPDLLDSLRSFFSAGCICFTVTPTRLFVSLVLWLWLLWIVTWCLASLSNARPAPAASAGVVPRHFRYNRKKWETFRRAYDQDRLTILAVGQVILKRKCGDPTEGLHETVVSDASPFLLRNSLSLKTTWHTQAECSSPFGCEVRA